MTEKRKQRLRNKLQESRCRIMDSNPFLSLLLMYLKFIADDETEKISTNGRCIYFSPDYVTKLTGDELDYLLCHQIMHIINGHIWREQIYSGAEYHFACDIQVNALLSRCGFDKDKYSHLPRNYKTISYEYNEFDTLEMTTDEIYNLCPHNLAFFPEERRKRFLPDDDFWWNEKYDEGSFGELILDIPEKDSFLRDNVMSESGNGNNSDSSQCPGGGGASGEGKDDSDDNKSSDKETQDDLQKEWENRMKNLVGHMNASGEKSSGYGGVPEFMERLVKQTKDAELDWRKILNDFLQERICDYSFSPPDRRFSETDFFLPDFNEKEYVSKDILFMVDTSGSVNRKELSDIYSEIKGAIEQFDGKLTGKLGFFDAGVKEPQPFENVDDLQRIIPYGGGGTDFRVIFEYIKENYSNELPACVVIFTDGDGPYPDEEDTMSLPVLWIVNNNRHIPPFGKVIRILTVDSFK